MIGRWCGLRLPPQALRPLTFISHRGFVARVLAHMLDSLVRVSRRVGDRHFVKHRETLIPQSAPRHGSQVDGKGTRKRDPNLPPWKRVPAALTDADTGRAESERPLLPAAASLLAISSPLHSLFKVLFIFPSRYLFAIGLLLIISFRRNLPPTLGCTRKQPDSTDPGRRRSGVAGRGWHPLRLPIQWELGHAQRWRRSSRLQFPMGISSLNSSLFTRRYWGIPC